MPQTCKLCWCRPALVAGIALTVTGLGACAPQAEWLEPTAAPYNADQIKTATTLTSNLLPGATVAQGIGTSMLPNSGEGTMFIVVPTRWEDLAVGQPVVYKDPTGKQIMHRLVRLEGDHWLVKGDNNEMIDDTTVTRENLVGVVAGTYHAVAPEEKP